MHGGEGLFVTTRWSVVCAAADVASPTQRAALEELCRAYWQPLYAFVRQSHLSEDARDLTQAFFARLLERGTVALAREERGRFRTFLLTSLRNFIADEHDRVRARKRGGGIEFLPLDCWQTEDRSQETSTAAESPDSVFDRQWALTVLDRAAGRLRAEFAARGRGPVFDQLKRFLLQDGEKDEFRGACASAGITLNNGRVTLHRLRERFPALVREEVAQTVRTPDELAVELRHLLEVLAV